MLWLTADIDRCVGCHTCEVACKKEHDLPEGVNWINVFEVGPAEFYGNLAMDFIPHVSDECTMCQHRIEEGSEPYCVSVCPTDALKCLDTSKMLENIRTGKRIQLLKRALNIRGKI